MGTNYLVFQGIKLLHGYYCNCVVCFVIFARYFDPSTCSFPQITSFRWSNIIVCFIVSSLPNTMANTSRTMASRKRPPPTNGAAANNGGAKPAAVASAGNVAIGGIDALLAKYARHLPPGGTITVQLIKGPTSTSVDPIVARKAAAKAARAAGNNANASGMSSGNDSDTGAPVAGASAAAIGRKKGITAPLPFPRMAKFNETVTSPNFAKGSLKDGRMYEEEVPKAKVRFFSFLLHNMLVEKK